MELNYEYNRSALSPVNSWARLILPGDDLPKITNALDDYVHMPWHLDEADLRESLLKSADMASHYFDSTLSKAQRAHKYQARYALFQNSIKNKDGSLFFIKDQKNFYGYTRVMPVHKHEWGNYFQRQAITEAEIPPCDKTLLSSGQASIYIQAIVFPEFAIADKKNKRILQEAGFAGLIGHLLPETLPPNGIDVYFTAFHPYTERLANRLSIDAVGENRHGHKIYGFNISAAAPSVLGVSVAQRMNAGKAAFSRFAAPQEQSLKPNIFLGLNQCPE